MKKDFLKGHTEFLINVIIVKLVKGEIAFIKRCNKATAAFSFHDKSILSSSVKNKIAIISVIQM